VFCSHRKATTQITGNYLLSPTFALKLQRMYKAVAPPSSIDGESLIKPDEEKILYVQKVGEDRWEKLKSLREKSQNLTTPTSKKRSHVDKNQKGTSNTIITLIPESQNQKAMKT
jgi:hypothetical protein